MASLELIKRMSSGLYNLFLPKRVKNNKYTNVIEWTA